MRVTDLIPWRPSRGSAPAARSGDADGNDPIVTLQNDINRAFDGFLRLFPMPFAGWPASLLDSGSGMQVDVAETDKEVTVTAELPGVDDAEIDVRVDDGMLIIGGEKKSDREIDDKGYILRERRFGRVERIVPLPDGLDADAAQASFKGGILTVTIPKAADAQPTATRIQVQSG